MLRAWATVCTRTGDCLIHVSQSRLTFSSVVHIITIYTASVQVPSDSNKRFGPFWCPSRKMRTSKNFTNSETSLEILGSRWLQQRAILFCNPLAYFCNRSLAPHEEFQQVLHASTPVPAAPAPLPATPAPAPGNDAPGSTSRPLPAEEQWRFGAA